MADILLVLFTGFLTGITTLVFGFGGGFVVVPFVYHVVSSSGHHADQAMHIAVATSAAVMILNASYASMTQWRSGTILPETIHPLIYFIAVGAVIGALAATQLTDSVMRVLFILYMVVTIADCLLRKGFLTKPARTTLSPAMVSIGGPLIGVIAAMLGVGGSVMTVPLLRRQGYEMKYCVSAANPLSIPVAVVATALYSYLGAGKVSGPEYFGYVNLLILGGLLVAGMAGIVFAKRVLPGIDDRLHARIYLLLLLGVLIAICL